MSWDPDDDEEWVADEDEYKEPGVEEGADTVPCPYCRKPVHEDAQRCPHCEAYISQEDGPPSRKPVWILVGILVCLAIAIMWALGS